MSKSDTPNNSVESREAQQASTVADANKAQGGLEPGIKPRWTHVAEDRNGATGQNNGTPRDKPQTPDILPPNSKTDSSTPQGGLEHGVKPRWATPVENVRSAINKRGGTGEEGGSLDPILRDAGSQLKNTAERVWPTVKKGAAIVAATAAFVSPRDAATMAVPFQAVESRQGSVANANDSANQSSGKEHRGADSQHPDSKRETVEPLYDQVEQAPDKEEEQRRKEEEQRRDDLENTIVDLEEVGQEKAEEKWKKAQVEAIVRNNQETERRGAIHGNAPEGLATPYNTTKPQDNGITFKIPTPDGTVVVSSRPPERNSEDSTR